VGRTLRPHTTRWQRWNRLLRRLPPPPYNSVAASRVSWAHSVVIYPLPLLFCFPSHPSPHLLANLCSCNTPLPLDALQGYLSTIALPTDYAMQFVLTTGTTVAAAWQNLIHLTVRDTPTPFPFRCLFVWGWLLGLLFMMSAISFRMPTVGCAMIEHHPPLPIAI
jgi:hypothetical protein